MRQSKGSPTKRIASRARQFPYTPSPPGTSVAQSNISTAVIGGVAGGVSLVVVVAFVVFMVLRHRRHTFKGDYSTKKHVYGNGYSKAGIPQHHPPMAQNLQYPDDSDDEKKAGPLGGNSYEDEEEDAAGGDRKLVVSPNKYDDDSKRPYFTVDEGEAHPEAYDERTLGFQYDPEQLDIADNMVSQNDGSFISKKEWYV
uniref:Nectin-1 n=1 Tax=Sphaerodactylus townsendi TaxID=933632 RepID=A0ACB8EYK6_9SAUR